jgi:beta-lactam-binding protein with PASTA domain
VKASLGCRLPCEGKPSWHAARIVLAIVFSVAIAVPLAGQEPSPTQSPDTHRRGLHRVPDTHRPGSEPAPGRERVPDMQRSGRRGPAQQGHGTQGPGTQDHGTQGRQTVPSVMGKSPQEANAILGQRGLKGMESGRAPSTDYRAGTVSRQDPSPNAPVPKNRLVRYWVAQGPSQTVPSIMGRSPQDVNAILGQYNLRGIESGRGPSSDYRAGTVSRQDPSPNAPIPKNRLVRYWVAQGPSRTIPSIMGKSPQDANAILGQRGLRGTESGREPSRDYRPGTVSRQDPPPNAPIPEDGLVRYWLAQGPLQTVPSILGSSPRDVNAILGQYGLRGTESGREPSRDYQAGTVSRQDPPPNAPIPENRLVRYRLAQEPQRVPSIMGKSPQDVNTILAQYGLRGTESGREPSRDYQPGTVSRQDPPPNAPIPENGLVSYLLAEETQVSPSTGSTQVSPSPGSAQVSPSPGSAQVSPSPGSTQVSPKPGSIQVSPSPSDWESFLQKTVRLRMVDIVLGALVAIGVVALIVHWSKRYDGRRPPKVAVVPVKDKDYYGEQYVAPSPLVLTVNLCPVLDPGEQALDKVGPLVHQGGSQWTSNI